MDDIYQQQDQTGFHTDLAVGEILRRTRVYYNLSLAQVSADLRIRTVQLDAIERSAYEELPGRVYAIGFLRTYAEYLGLDGEKIIALFKTQEGGKQTESELNFPVPASESRIPNYKALSGATLLLIGLSTAWFWLVRDNDSVAALSIPDVPKKLEQKVSIAKNKGKLDAPDINKADTPRGDTLAVPDIANREKAQQATDSGIVLKATADVWVEIRNEQDEIILSEILKKGERYPVPANDKGHFVMATGNAGGLEISVNGRTLDNLGASGEVKRGIALSDKGLKAFSNKQ